MTLLADRFEIVRELGRGSFAQTLLAHDRLHDRQVALKLFDPRHATDWKAQELFEREAAVLRALRHHGIPEIFDYLRAERDGATVALLVMEYVDGVSLATMIEEKRTLGLDDVLHLLLELLGILDYLHGRVPPILHRDIKPSNIVVRPDGTPVLVDFGSVRRVFLQGDESGSTIAGTYGYMPYEQYMGQATPSSDLYALAATMLHLLTGRMPADFIGDHGALEVPPVAPGDQRLGAVLQRMLRPSPAARFASARDARQALLGASAVAPALVEPVVAQLPAGASLLPATTPRQLEGGVARLLEEVSPRVRSLMDTSSKPGDRPGLVDWATILFFSVVTVGVFPVVFYGYARARRRRLARFFVHGTEALAEVRTVESESTAFGEKIAKVSYHFQADGELRRGVDRVLPAIAERWAPGDRIRVLYVASADYDSVVISTR